MANVRLDLFKEEQFCQVLFDQNDFNEVLRKTDETMASVKSIFHDSVSRKSGRPNITLAPGSKMPPPVQPDPDQPSKLDALSDSVMDNKALNEQSSSDEDECAGEAQFESKVDYGRFMTLLKDSMNKKKTDTAADTSITPVKGPATKPLTALNCTEEVKRTLSRISSIREESDTELKKKEETRKIDEVIHGIKKDANKLEQNLNKSSFSTIPNHTQCSMSYEGLQDAMANVHNQLRAFEARTGRSMDQDPPELNGSLAGFTVTLIDSVTRLTTYVNEGELRTQNVEKSLDELKQKFDEQVKVNEALALELVNTQKVIKQDQERIASLHNELQEAKSDVEWRRRMEERVDELCDNLKELESKLVISENTIVEGGDALVVEDIEIDGGRHGESIALSTQGSEKKESDMKEAALKSDMLRLLSALKTQNEKACEASLPVVADNTQEAARTIASVESHLRHLQLQHAEAQQRMNELTRQAQMHTASSSHASSINASVSPSMPSDSCSLASLPSRLPGKPLMQTNVEFVNDRSKEGHPTTMQTVVDFPDFESDLGSFKLLEEDTSSDSLLSSLLSSPHIAEQQQQALNKVQKAQMSLEERIAELNRQHGQAQERLQRLVTRRKSEKLKENPRKVQICLPSMEMLQTPQQVPAPQ